MKTRTDKHRVSKIVPADYRYLFSFSYPGMGGSAGWNIEMKAATKRGDEFFSIAIWGDLHGYPVITGHEKVKNPLGKLNYFEKENKAGGCDVCGTHYIHGDVWQHVPTGECIELGHQCAEKYGLLADRNEWKKEQRISKDRRARAIERSLRWAGLTSWVRENHGVLDLLKIDHSITKDMRSKLIRTGARWGLSENQIGLLRKLEEDSKKPPEQHVPVPVDGERITVEGLVVSYKESDGPFGGFKMTVKVETETGSWLVFGTAPDALKGPLKGCRVKFSATVKKGNRDEFFGFFSRPTKAELLEEVGAGLK